MKSSGASNYDFYRKKYKSFVFSETEINKYFTGLDQLKSVDKKSGTVYFYLKYAAAAIAVCFVIVLTIYFPVRKTYIDNKYKNMLYTELTSSYKKTATSTLGAEYIATPKSYDYLENSLDLLSDNN
jgi:hypothetical protein